MNIEKQNENLNNNVAEKDAKVISSTNKWYLPDAHTMHIIAIVLEIFGYVFLA